MPAAGKFGGDGLDGVELPVAANDVVRPVIAEDHGVGDVGGLGLTAEDKRPQ